VRRWLPFLRVPVYKACKTAIHQEGVVSPGIPREREYELCPRKSERGSCLSEAVLDRRQVLGGGGGGGWYLTRATRAEFCVWSVCRRGVTLCVPVKPAGFGRSPKFMVITLSQTRKLCQAFFENFVKFFEKFLLRRKYDRPFDRLRDRSPVGELVEPPREDIGEESHTEAQRHGPSTGSGAEVRWVSLSNPCGRYLGEEPHTEARRRGPSTGSGAEVRWVSLSNPRVRYLEKSLTRRRGGAALRQAQGPKSGG
jgi:hypothetical protein